MKRYVLTTEARQDIREIRKHYLEKAGVRVAQCVLDEITRAMRFVGETPGAGHVRQDLTSYPVKFWQVFSYFIIYDPAPRPIEITRILHSSRDIAALLA